jgi:transcriptional regulator with XRE-family HTH domain
MLRWETLKMSENQAQARRSNELGPTGRQVAANVRRLRTVRGLTTTELARRLTEEHGRPTIPGAITRIEHGKRRVDVDDLLALAAAFQVSPSALLLPPNAKVEIEVTGTGTVPAHDAWRWLDGQWPLSSSRDPETLRRQLLDFHLYSRPEGIPPYHNVDGAVRWMADFGETPHEKAKSAPALPDQLGESPEPD